MPHEHTTAAEAGRLWCEHEAETAQLERVQQILRGTPQRASWDQYGMAGRVFMIIEDVTPDDYDAGDCEEFWREVSGRYNLPDESWVREFLQAAVAADSEFRTA